MKKTEVLHQPKPQEEYHPPHVPTGETELKSVKQFTYLGCSISSNAHIDSKIDNRLNKANCAFGRLHKRVWDNKHIKCTTKISVYRAVVLTTLLYGSESWVTYRSSLNDSTNAAYVPSLTSTGVTTSATLKSWNVRRSQASKQCY